MAPPPLLPGFDPTLLLVLNLVGTFVFGLSGGMAAVRAKLDLLGAVVLAVVVGIAGGTIRDLLIGTPPATFRDWRYLAVAGGAGLLTTIAHPAIDRLQRQIDALAAGDHTVTFPIVGAVVCCFMRMAGLRYGLRLPGAADMAVTDIPRLRRGHAAEDDGDSQQQRQPPENQAASSRR